MKTYDVHSPCEKCRACDAYTRWRPADDSPSYFRPPGHARLTDEEHLERECGRCGFKWAEGLAQ